MRLVEFTRPVCESVTFGVAELITDHPNFPKGLMTGEKWWRKEMQKCPFCDNGKEHYPEYKDPETGKVYPAHDVDCDYCGGKGEHLKHVSDSPELNISNSNAVDLLDYLGINSHSDNGLVGQIDPRDMPTIRRKLIKMKNGGADDLVTPWKDETGPTQKGRDEHGNPSISRGPRIIHGGRTPDQVMRYIDSLLAIIEFAQKHNAYVTWA